MNNKVTQCNVHIEHTIHSLKLLYFTLISQDELQELTLDKNDCYFFDLDLNYYEDSVKIRPFNREQFFITDKQQYEQIQIQSRRSYCLFISSDISRILAEILSNFNIGYNQFLTLSTIFLYVSASIIQLFAAREQFRSYDKTEWGGSKGHILYRISKPVTIDILWIVFEIISCCQHWIICFYQFLVILSIKSLHILIDIIVYGLKACCCNISQTLCLCIYICDAIQQIAWISSSCCVICQTNYNEFDALQLIHNIVGDVSESSFQYATSVCLLIALITAGLKAIFKLLYRNRFTCARYFDLISVQSIWLISENFEQYNQQGLSTIGLIIAIIYSFAYDIEEFKKIIVKEGWKKIAYFLARIVGYSAIISFIILSISLMINVFSVPKPTNMKIGAQKLFKKEL